MVSIDGQIETGALIAIYAGWEALKMAGLTDLIKSRFFKVETPVVLSPDDRKTVYQHYEACRACVKCQDKQVEILEQIKDATVEIKAYMLRPR
jgi:hypothetical protein